MIQTPKILFLKGLPASGKSFFAKGVVANEPDKWVRVNKDSLRQMLHEGKWSKGREKTVQAMQQAMVHEALQAGMSVIIDDTNFAKKHEVTYRDIARQHDAEFEVLEVSTSVDECIERDSKRGAESVGKDVILRMFYQYLCKDRENFEGKSIIICDLDGTLALMKDRGPFEWDKVGSDTLNMPVALAIESFVEKAFEVIIVSGRDESCREITEKWLKDYGIEYKALYMRPAGNMEKDTIIKERIYNEHICGKYHVVCVFDDRPCVVRFWRKQGLFVFDCGNGIEF